MSAFTAATRPTLRDMRTHPWRSLAALMMIFIPMALIAGTIVYESSIDAQHNLGRIDTSITLAGASNCQQDIYGLEFECQGDVPTIDEYDTLKDAVPGFDFYLSVGSDVSSHNGDRKANFTVDQIDYAPNAPLPGPREVLLPDSTMKELNVNVGDTITVDDLGEWTVVGRSATYRAIVSSPTLVEPREYSAADHSPYIMHGEWNPVGTEPMTWSEVQELNKLGFVVASADIVDNPLPESEQYDEFLVDHQSYGQPDLFMGAFFLAMLCTGFVFLFLFIMPVFAISAGRQARNYAVMRSQGASPSQIRLSVMAYGLFTGLVGATIGLIVGALGSAIIYATRYPGWPLDFGWELLLVGWLGAVIGSTIAAFIPAVITARQSIASGIQGAAPDKMMRFRSWFLAGPIAFTVGLVMIITPPRNFVWMGLLMPLGWPILLAGAAGCAPLLVYAVSRLGASLPLVSRLAMRDVSRQALRSIPSVAVIIAVSTLGVLIYSTTIAGMKMGAEWSAKTYNPAAVLVSSAYHGAEVDPDALGELVAEVESIVGPVEQHVVEGNYDVSSFVETGQCSYSSPYSDNIEEQQALDSEGNDPEVDPEAARACLGTLRSIPIASPWAGGMIVASEATLQAYNFENNSDYRQALEILNDPAVLAAKGSVIVDTVTLEVADYSKENNSETENSESVVKALPVLPEAEYYELITAGLFDELEIEYFPLGVLLVAKQPITSAQHAQLDALSEDSATGFNVTTLASFEADWYLAWLVAGGLATLILVIIALVMSLSAQSTNTHFALLAAIGAPPTLPRRVSGMYASIIAIVGTLFGTLTGQLVAWASSDPSAYDINGEVLSVGTRDYLTVDWTVFAVLLVGVPLVAYGIGLLFHREAKPNAYRET